MSTFGVGANPYAGEDSPIFDELRRTSKVPTFATTAEADAYLDDMLQKMEQSHRHAVLMMSGSVPPAGVTGDTYVDTVSGQMYVHTGSGWQRLVK